MELPQLRTLSQRKRSYSTTAYSSLEEDAHALSNNKTGGAAATVAHAHAQASPPKCLLAAAVGSQLLTYEFISNSIDNPTATPKLPQQQQPPIAIPGQYEGTLISKERTAHRVSSLKWSPDNALLAIEAQDGRIFLHDNKGRLQETLESRSGNNRCAISWAPKPQRLYFANGQKVMTWDSTLKRTAETFETTSRINALAINSDDTLLAIGQNSGNLDVVNRTTGNSARLDTSGSLIMSRMEYSVFNRSMLGGIGNDGILRLWDTGSSGTTAMYHSFTATHEVPISSMAFSPFNRYLICTAGLDKRYALYDVEQKKVVKNKLTDHALTSVTFKNDGISMAFGTEDGKVLLYDLRSTSRPISIVDTQADAPVTAVHFQGKQSSSVKRHQTINGHALKRQNSAGSTPSIFSKDSTPLTTSTAITSFSTPTTTTAAAISGGASASSTKSLTSRPTPIKTATLSQPLLSQLKSSGDPQITREVQSAGPSTRGIFDLFSSQRGSETATPTDTRGNDKLSIRSRRPTGPAAFSTSSTPATTTLSMPPKFATLSTSSSTARGSAETVFTPTTPSRENPNISGGNHTHSVHNGNRNGSRPNSRTVSPFAFQIMQQHSPSGESSSSSPSINTPPGSPGANAGRPLSQSHLHHHHYQSLSKSPSQNQKAKRRKSFGTLMASGGAGSAPGTPDPISEEKMEILRGQIVDSVRNVLLDHPAPATFNSTSNDGRLRSQSHSSRNPVPTSTTEAGATAISASSTSQESTRSKAPFKDIWMQLGLEDTVNGSGTSSMVKATQQQRMSGSVVATGRSDNATAVTAAAGGSSSSVPSLTNSFPSQVLEGVIEGCLADFRTGIRNDIQNMHLELLRQFQIQKMEIEGLLKRYTDTKQLQEENDRLQEENQRLRMNY
ncbi:Protein nedd1 [Haplosporangium sp. Z 767]|nr:Protein nedd1 [Haplosporangium sp. Z 767]KAF9184313.1 Protein nedd1 [Haplosporangium sp. Z 11]